MITLQMIFYSSMGMFNIFVNICMSFSVKPPVAVAKAAYYTITQQPNPILQPNQYSFLRQEMKTTLKNLVLQFNESTPNPSCIMCNFPSFVVVVVIVVVTRDVWFEYWK